MYDYLPVEKFVTDEVSIKNKLGKYQNDVNNPAKIKQRTVIIYVENKKAKGPDGKDLKLVDAKNLTRDM